LAPDKNFDAATPVPAPILLKNKPELDFTLAKKVFESKCMFVPF
jgi:hypothetical protein